VIKLSGVVKRYPGRTATGNAVDGVDLEIAEGELVTLLGPSGCGKTSTLRLIAGLERPTGGEISIGGQTVAAPDRGIFLGANRRPIGIVFQSYAIWPHMTVLENVMFPLRAQRPKATRAAAREAALEVLSDVGLADFADRPAPMLSGGQQQRVALARALVRRPKVLLLDEPLSNLDAGLRDRMRDEIRAVQQRLGITTVFVTHDQDEALAVSDRVIVMNSGQIVEGGLPQEIYAWPTAEFTARFLGVSNMMTGSVTALREETVDITTEAGTMSCRACEGLAVGDAVSVFMRPESFRMSRTARTDHDWSGTIDFSIYQGDCWDYHVTLVNGEAVKVRVYREKVGLSHGDQVFLEPDQESALVMPESGVAHRVPVREAAPSKSPSAS
jgi:iron(III) transport system ATP-binding protein